MFTHSSKTIDVTGIGNAIVDVIANISDDYIQLENLPKGAMMLVDAEQASRLYNQMGPSIKQSGGSCANTMAAFASMGGKGAFIGKVQYDELGHIFEKSMLDIGVHFNTPKAFRSDGTGMCLVHVTPDAERTMCTYIGAAQDISVNDIDFTLIKNAKVLYLEGYLWDRDNAKEVFIEASRLAAENQTSVALSLSDQFCVDRHREGFLNFIIEHVDILFANESEICSLFETNDFEEAYQQIQGKVMIAALTRSEKPTRIVTETGFHDVPTVPVSKVVDTTGAGDLYAAGFLYGYLRSNDPLKASRIGAEAASHILQQYGARSDVPLKKIISLDGITS